MTKLHLAIEAALNQGKDTIDWPNMDVEEFFGSSKPAAKPAGAANGAVQRARYASLFDADDSLDA